MLLFGQKKPRFTIIFALMTMALLLTSCGPPSVSVTEQSYHINFANDTRTLPSGELYFNVQNNASDQAHEFVIFKTNLPGDQLPRNADGDVDEQGQGITHIDEVEDIGVGETKTLKVNLPPGNYVAICNLPGHYAQGMYYSFTVK